MFEGACQLPVAARAAEHFEQEPANGLQPLPGRTVPLLAAGTLKLVSSKFLWGQENSKGNGNLSIEC